MSTGRKAFSSNGLPARDPAHLKSVGAAFPVHIGVAIAAAAFFVGVCFVGLLSSWSRGAPETTVPDTPTGPTATGPAPELDQLRNEVRLLTAQMRDLSVGVEAAQDDVRDVVPKMELFLSALAVMLAVGGAFVGFWGWHDRKEVREEARKTLDEAESAKIRLGHYVKEAALHNEELRRGAEAVESAKAQLERVGEFLESVVRPQVPMVLTKDPAPMEPRLRVRFEDSDSVLLVFDQLPISEPVRKADRLVKVAVFWRAARDFPRSLARLKRAQEQAPEDPTIYRETAETLGWWVAVDRLKGVGQDSRKERLKEAHASLDEAARLQKRPEAGLLLQRAWLLDEGGDFEGAMQNLLRARRLDRRATRGSGRSEDWDITYNLACTLARAGRQQEALKELNLAIVKDRNWELAERDPDLDALKVESPWKEQFESMVDSARRQQGG